MQFQSVGQSSPGEGNGNPVQYSCLENPMGGEAWRAAVCAVAESDMTEPLTHTSMIMLLVKTVTVYHN